jgi:hypothetical protein
LAVDDASTAGLRRVGVVRIADCVGVVGADEGFMMTAAHARSRVGQAMFVNRPVIKRAFSHVHRRE